MLVSVELNNSEEPSCPSTLQRINDLINSSKKIVVVTGAGISVSAGIPDFRSADGLYARVLSSSIGSDTKKNVVNAKGKDFFDASFFHAPNTRPLFNKFVAELKEMCDKGKPTSTHQFLKCLFDSGKLIRWYTQNIDGLEKASGLKTSSCDPLTDISLTRTTIPVVTLHGTLDRLACTICKAHFEYKPTHNELFLKGESPNCEKCEKFSSDRQERGRRAVKGGFLRPDIVLYNEPHPYGDLIADFVINDIRKRPTILLIMGTSLKVAGLKKIIKDFSRAIHEHPEGKVIFVNKTMAPRSEWKSIFDYEVLGECDQWVKGLTISSNIKSDKNKVNPITLSPKKDRRIDQIFKVVRKTNSNLVIQDKLEVKVKKDEFVEKENQVSLTTTSTIRKSTRLNSEFLSPQVFSHCK